MSTINKSFSASNISEMGDESTPLNFVSLRSKRMREEDLPAELEKFEDEMRELLNSFICTQQNQLKGILTNLKEIQDTNHNIDNSIALLTSQNEEFRRKIEVLECQSKKNKPDPEKEKAKALQAELDKKAKELRPNWKEWKPGDPGEQTCESCGRPVDGKVKCHCSGKDNMKTIRKTLCPCSAYTETPKPPEVPSPPEPAPVPDGTKKICKCCVCEGGKAKKGVNCTCAENTCIEKRQDKERCDCFTEPIPETPIDYEILTDLIAEQKQIEMQNSLKLISEKTQMVSGFKIRMRKKPLAEMTLEEAIKYFALHPEEAPEPIPDIEDCICEEVEALAQTKRKPSWKARLSLLGKRGTPEPPSPPELIEISPVRPREHRLPGGPGAGTYPDFDDFNPKGLKVAVGGKGSGSQGLKCLKNLKGVCIFDLLQDQTFPTTSKSRPDSPE